MIYWLKKLEWKIRKRLGLYNKRVKTLDDVTIYNEKLIYYMIFILIGVIILTRVAEGLALAWKWFFRKPSFYPSIPL
jgi:hypothetical protein